MDYKKQTLLNTVANVVYLAVQWLFTVFATRLVSVEVAGVLTFSVSLTNILYTIENYGMRPYQVSDSEGEFSSKQYINLRYFTTAIGIGMCVVFLLITGYTLEKAAVIFLFFMYRSAEAVSDVYFGELQKREKLHLSAYSMLAKSVISAVLFGLLTYLTKGLVIPLLVITVIAYLFVFADRCIYVKAGNVQRNPEEPSSIKGPLKVGFFMMLAMLFPIMVTSLPRMSLDAFYGEEMLGYFGNVAMPTTLIVAIVPNILTPIMSLYGRWLSEGKYKELRKMYFFTLIGSAAVAGVFLLGFLLLGKFFMSFIYGKDIIPYLHYMYPLIITTTLYAITMCNTSVLIAMRSNAIVWISSALSCVVTAACCFLLVKPFGIEGLILTLGVAYALQIAVQEVGIIKSFLLQIKNPDLKEE